MIKIFFLHAIKRKWYCVLCSVILLSLHAPAQTSIPHLKTTNDKTQLIVNDKPFLILGGELGNSAASSRAYMQPIWLTRPEKS